MKQLRAAISLFLLAMLLTIVAPMHPTKTNALYDHPTVQESARAAFTPFEASVRTTRNYYVADTWVSPKEGHVVVERDTRRWHRAQTARRVL